MWADSSPQFGADWSLSTVMAIKGSDLLVVADAVRVLCFLSVTVGRADPERRAQIIDEDFVRTLDEVSA
eukprot:6861394-Pyramimonas_sp.AAC.1